MKTFFLAITLTVLLVFAARDVPAQVYVPYSYASYWDIQYHHYLQWQQYLNYLQRYDPYYDLHVMHYQLYLRPFHPIKYTHHATPGISLHAAHFTPPERL